MVCSSHSGVSGIGERRVRGFRPPCLGFSTVGKLAPGGGRGSRSPASDVSLYSISLKGQYRDLQVAWTIVANSGICP